MTDPTRAEQAIAGLLQDANVYQRTFETWQERENQRQWLTQKLLDLSTLHAAETEQRVWDKKARLIRCQREDDIVVVDSPATAHAICNRAFTSCGHPHLVVVGEVEFRRRAGGGDSSTITSCDTHGGES